MVFFCYFRLLSDVMMYKEGTANKKKTSETISDSV